MAVSAGSAYINIDARLNDLEKKLKSGVPKAADSATKSAGKTMTAGFKKVAVSIGGLFAAQQVFSFGADALAEAREANVVAAETEQRIKSTGGAAGVTADEVANLSEELSLKAGVDDELIQSGANLILTFKNIKNAAGEGNDIFDQANTLALDLSKAFKTDLKSASIQVGKALDNPIKGVTALTRVGVTFTDQQKEQIKALVESGDLIGAQKIILGELESQVGGTAEATATASDKATVAWGNVKETLGQVLLPVVERVTGMLAVYLPLAVEWVKTKFEEWKPTIEDVGNVLKGVAEFVADNKDAFIAFAAVIGTVVVAWRAYTIAVGLATAAQALLNAILLANPIGLVIVGIALLVAAVIYAYNRFEWFREGVQTVWRAIQTAVSVAVDFITTVIQVGMLVITGRWSDAWDLIREKMSGVWEGIKSVAGTAVEFIVNLFSTIGSKIGSALSTVGEAITAPFRAAWNALANFWNSGPGQFSFSIPGWVPVFGGNTFDMPDMPTLHSGGIFTAPYGQTEGLALLEDGEGVFTREQMAAMGGRRGAQQVTINNQFPTDPDVALAALRRAEGLYAA